MSIVHICTSHHAHTHSTIQTNHKSIDQAAANLSRPVGDLWTRCTAAKGSASALHSCEVQNLRHPTLVITYTHTHIHTHVRTAITSCVHTFIRSYINTSIDPWIYTFIPRHTHAYIHLYIYTSIICIYIYIYIYIYTQ